MLLQAAISAQQMFQTRIQSEDEARSSRPTPNRLLAQSLVDLLEERKYAETKKEVEILAKKHGISMEKLERLACHVNSVSVDHDSVKRWVGEDGNENISMVVGVIPSMTRTSYIHGFASGNLGESSHTRREGNAWFFK